MKCPYLATRQAFLVISLDLVSRDSDTARLVSTVSSFAIYQYVAIYALSPVDSAMLQTSQCCTRDATPRQKSIARFVSPTFPIENGIETSNSIVH
jgi:hypothetical protein